MNHDEFVRLYRLRNTLKDQLEQVQGKITEMSDEIVDGLAESGLQNIRTTSGATIYVKRTLVPRPVNGDYDRACDALEASGLEHLSKRTFHWSSVASAIKKMEAAGEPMPKSFDGAIELFEKFTAVVLAAGKEE